MIITVTVNPALDKTAEISSLRVGGLNRINNLTVDAGGKGINVSKMIHALNGYSLATGFLGGGSGEELRRQLTALGISHDFVQVEAATRTNLKVLAGDSGITELNEPGLRVSLEEEAELREKLLSLANEEAIFVLSGSIPSNLPVTYYRDLTMALHERGAQVFVDAEGEVLRAALEAAPELIKPNREELTELFGQALEADLSELQSLCFKLLEGGVGFVALSMGDEGALFASKENCLRAEGLDVHALSTVGAGDCMMAALAFAKEQTYSMEQSASLAIAAGAAAVTTAGTKAPLLDLVKQLEKRVILRRM